MSVESRESDVRRIIISKAPFFNPEAGYWSGRGTWPASWIDHPDRPLLTPSVALFRLEWSSDERTATRIHVSADNRYRLFLDGQPVGRGPERCSPERWLFESYDLDLQAGRHVLLAQTWWLGNDIAPWAQMSIRPGFLLAAEGVLQNVISTGLAKWEAALMPGYSFPPISRAAMTWSAVGNRLKVDGCVFPWGFEKGDIGNFLPAKTIAPAFSEGLRDSNHFWTLSPATLPAMIERERLTGKLRHLSEHAPDEPVLASNNLERETAPWQAWLDGKASVQLPPRARRVAVIDIGDYCCAYPLLTVSGGSGSKIRLDWAESLYIQTDKDTAPQRSKGNRDEIEGRFFIGMGDEFLPDGGNGREFTTLWWEAGRYMQLVVETGDEPLELEAFKLFETRYPLEMEGDWNASNKQLEDVIPVAMRALQMCSHETYFDCPYYEQLMYAGDTRLQVLTTYVTTRDDRLPRKALYSFADSRRLSGFTRSAFPSHTLQIIPPFSLWWVCMVNDYRMWRDTSGWTLSLLPAVRSVMEAFRGLLREDGLLAAPPEWNFVDWSVTWQSGIPPRADFEPSCVINLQCVLALLAKADMESGVGENELATRDRAAAESLLNAIRLHFWSGERSLFADLRDKSAFSEHAQCLAVLSGLLTREEEQQLATALTGENDLAKVTIYFTHYLFEAFYRLGRADLIPERMSLWYDLLANGLRTTIEMPEPTRSDCHAWGAHPLYHYYASLLGIRPAAQGFSRVRIAPQPGRLEFIKGRLPHPSGFIEMDLHRKSDGISANIVLPDGIAGEFEWNGQAIPLNPGSNDLS